MSFFSYNRDHPYYPTNYYNGNDTVPLGQRIIRLNAYSPNYHGYFIPEVQLHDFYYHPHDNVLSDMLSVNHNNHNSLYTYPLGISTPPIYQKSEYNTCDNIGSSGIYCKPPMLHYLYHR